MMTLGILEWRLIGPISGRGAGHQQGTETNVRQRPFPWT